MDRDEILLACVFFYFMLFLPDLRFFLEDGMRDSMDVYVWAVFEFFRYACRP